MTNRSARLLSLVSEMTEDIDGDVSLAVLARQADWSASHLHRSFKDFVGESPKQFTQRVRLEKAVAGLVVSDASILEIALETGFASHEVFSRAFRRHYGCSPKDFRRAVKLAPDHAATFRDVMHTVSPCLGLYRVSLTHQKERGTMPTLDIEKKELQNEQPVLFIQRRIPMSDLQATMAECFPAIYQHAMATGLAIAGQPIARYVSTGVGLWTVDFAIPLLEPATANGEMRAGALVSGPVAFAVHHGPYDQLGESNAAIERWIDENGYTVGGAPWESYVTDPGQTPDPADWKTELFWPLKT